MTELILERAERLELRAGAHHLPVTVLLGSQGLTEAVMKEIDRALNDHGLIKIHVPSDDREERVEMYHTIAEQLGAARIQMIGKMLVLYRPSEKAEAEKARAEELLRSAAARDPGAKGVGRAKKERAAEKKGAPRKAPAKKKLTGKHGQRVINPKSKKRRVTKKAALS
ncbi:MAG TPA: ribosome assembly RNA-binding protein YhbY [Sutterella sp.]|nr:ribosome assembly RNA-binding protein YhbY [Sutterella sp.]